MEKTDPELLVAFVESGSEGSFEALVRRHAGMVFGAALRVTKNRELAEDTAQLVFAIMHRKSSALASHPCLPAWLHKSATLEASRIMRKERNHQRKTERFASATEAESSEAGEHPALEHLDEAMALLGSADRRFLILRFYQGHKLREIASLLGKSETAARKQSERALSRLSNILRKRGVALPAAALGGVLSGVFVEPAQAGLVTSITTGVAATSASLSKSTIVLNTLHTMSHGKLIAATATAVALLAAIPVGVQTNRLKQTKGELRQAQQEIAALPSAPPPSAAKAAPRPAAPTREPETLRELASASGATDTQFLRELLTRQIRPSHEEIAVFIGKKRSLKELRTMFDEVVDLPLSEHRQEAIKKLVAEIGRHDGQAAVELAASSLDSSSLRHHALGAAYKGWAAHDPEAAWAYAMNLPPEQRTAHPTWQIMLGAAEGDISAREFYDFVENNTKGLFSLSAGHLWRSLSHVYNHKDSQGMQSWVEGLESGHLKSMASSQLIQRMALSNPVAAREWMDANVDPYKNTEATKQLAHGWARVDPAAAMDWLTSLPRDLQTNDLYRGSLEQWLTFDQVGAARWLAAAEPSPMLDASFESYIYRVRSSNPSEAMTWAMEITNSERSLHMMNEVAKVWRKQDPEALEQFIDSEPAAASLR